jgi:LuxR family maltose regulon positive regulatory protein
VEQEALVLPAGRKAPVQVGSPQWYSWLTSEANSTFFFTDEAGSFTARKERRKRGGWYWIAYRSRGGRLSKTYLGRSEDLTLERLREVTALLTGQLKQHQVSPAQQQNPTRFTPPPLSLRQSRLIERTELLKHLNESLDVRLILVTAPAGYGKTTLLSRWYETYRQQSSKTRTIAWIALDERDNDSTRFWGAVWSALRGEGERGIDISIPLSSTPQMSIETVLAALLTAPSHGILILDDYHTIINQQIHEGMDLFLANLPSNVHLVIASRSEPPLSLGRARMYGELVELRSDDLRLSDEEIVRFFRATAGVELSTEERAMLVQRTEGWIAGLQMVELALREQQRLGEILARFAGSQRSLFDYFAQEVLARQPAEVQRFLLSTALLPELTPSLCAAVLGEEEQNNGETHAQQMLDALERANVFIVPLDEQRRRYRYHALFREFLQEQVKQSMPERIAELQQRAAGWYEQQGMIEEAIEHALAGQDSGRAVRLIERIGEEILWKRGEVGQLLTWMQQLPGIGQGEHPQLEVLYTWALLLGGQGDLKSVEALLAAIESRGDEAVTGTLKGDIAALRAKVAAFHDDIPQVIAYSQQALQVLPKERALLRADIVFGMSHTSKDLDESYRMLAEAMHISQAMGSLRTAMFSSRYLAATCIEQGRLTEAEAILQQALSIAGAGEGARVPVTGIIHIGLAELHYERNELAEALHHALLGTELGACSGEIKAVLSGSCILALIWTAQGAFERAWQELWKAERIAALGRVLWLREQMAAIGMHLALQQKDLGGAKRALQTIDIDTEGGLEQAPPLERAEERLLLARVWLAEEKYRAVVNLLDPVVQAAHQGKRVRMSMAAQALQAMALYKLRERQRAARILNEALTVAGPEGYARTFLDIGEPMQEILQGIEVGGGTRGYTRRLLEAGGTNSRERHGGLSEREYEVLHLLAAGMSNQEIAEALVVAISTVKVHVKHICQKLDVQRRMQAVAKARETGVL